MPERLVDDLDFFVVVERSGLTSLVGDAVGPMSALVFEVAIARGLPFVGEPDGEPALLCLSPSTLVLGA